MAEPDMRVAESQTPLNAAAAARRIDAALTPLRNVRRRRAAAAAALLTPHRYVTCVKVSPSTYIRCYATIRLEFNSLRKNQFVFVKQQRCTAAVVN